MKRSDFRTSRISFNLLLHFRKRSQSEGGYIIVVVGGLIFAMATMLITGELMTRVDNNSTKSSGNSAAGFSAAESGLNLRAEAVRTKFQAYNVPTGISPGNPDSSNNAPCQNGNNGSGDFACDSSLKIQDYLYPNDTTKQIQVSTYVNDLNTKVNGVDQPTSITIATGQPYAGLNAQEYVYNVISTAYDRLNNPTAYLGMTFKSRLVPLFQFAAFYQQDLDFSYPPSMTLNGPIHTNGNLFLDSSGGATLTINGDVSASGNLYRGEYLDNTCNGTVSIFSPIPSPGGFQTLGCNGTKQQYLQANVTPTWGPTQIQIGSTPLTLPPTNTFNADSTGQYWNAAQLRIVLNLNSNEDPTGIEVQTASGAVDTTSTNNLLGSTCAPISTTLKSSATINSNAVPGATTSVSGSTSLSTNGATATNFPAGSPIQLEPSGTTNYDTTNQTVPTINDDGNVVTGVSSNTISIRKQLGGGPTPELSLASFPANTVVRKPIVWTSRTFWNYREKYNPTNASRGDAKPIRMLNVDVQGLLSCAGNLMGGKLINDTTNGGLVWFLTVKGPNSNVNVNNSTPRTNGTSNTYAVRLYNGATLASTNTSDPAIKGLSIVSDQAIYVRGDYNSINKKPAAIMGDTINVLSNAWPLDDTYSALYTNGLQIANPNVSQPMPDNPVYIYSYDYGIPGGNAPPSGQAMRLASNTTINAAFLAGIDLTGGGLNNYPRLHEDWYNPNTGNRATLTYLGSMVSLGYPLRVNGPFCGSGTTSGDGGCNIYTPPIRNWSYDTDFNNAANLPPLTPRFVYLRQEIFSRNYTRSAFLSPTLPIASLLSSSFFSIPFKLGTVQFLF